MSGKSEKILEDIAKSLKSIHQRLGILLTRSENIKLSDYKLHPFPAEIHDLTTCQKSFGEVSKSYPEFARDLEQELHQLTRDELEEWEMTLGICPPVDPSDEAEMADYQLSLTFSDVAKHLQTHGVTANRQRQHTWLRQQLSKVADRVEGLTPYNDYLAGDCMPSKIAINWPTAEFLHQIILGFFKKGILPRKKS